MWPTKANRSETTACIKAEEVARFLLFLWEPPGRSSAVVKSEEEEEEEAVL